MSLVGVAQEGNLRSAMDKKDKPVFELLENMIRNPDAYNISKEVELPLLQKACSLIDSLY